MRRVLCLGSTGFLGAHVAGQLRALPGVRVLGGGRTTPVPASRDLSSGGPPVDSLPIDLATIPVEALTEVLRALAPHAVVNCVGAVGSSPLRLAELNTRGPAVLCEALRRAAPGARLVHLGSAGEYGATTLGRPVDESAPTLPQGAYGATKLAGTLIVSQSALDATVLRVFNPIGPGSPEASLPGRLAAELRRALPEGADGVVRVGDLSAYRDYIDVRDVARAVVLAAMAPGPLPRLLNIAGGDATPVRAIAEGLVVVSGFRGRIEESGPGSHRSASVSWQRADISAAVAALGWRPRLTLARSLADLWNEGAPAPATAPDPAPAPPAAPPRAPVGVPAAP
ncbi:NAD-dependent epimerase/dehydratase family protein [Streptomyces sp. H39-S7]|uniref:NAD-dependent epimerase/dehydratase family protein n=1 Tax=Streptomyces sp. H39-S7 TaxID=3004357 RepID=UPI0022B00454|nr:NAD(P)-dependent oxidoreductase [Streptomyces sp. H39-S7]MCZ4125061.1 NAD(P)-dependent oxidoreductase [Streptomyces sp. H39-S7]